MAELGPGQALDRASLARLLTWVGEQRPGFWSGEVRAERVGEGRSNLTFLVTDGRQDAILRCPPLGAAAGSAHDVGREYRFLSALSSTSVPLPDPYAFCDDPEVIGRSFYLMERVPGRIFGRRTDTERLSRDEARRISDSLIDTLVLLHAVDPEVVGLSDVGDPVGFTARHLERWTFRLTRSATRSLPALERLAGRLAEQVPASGRTTVVHGDYRLGNVVVAPERPEVRAVLDWEMATVGDPLTDLGWMALSWVEADGPDGVSEQLGFPSLHDVLGRYRRKAGVEDADIDWYIAFACLKLGVIREGIRGRHQRGETWGPGFAEIGDRVESVAAHGLRLLQVG